MPLLMLKDVPRYQCLCEAAEKYPSLEPSAADAFFHLLRCGDEVSSVEGRFLASRGISQGRFAVLMLLNCCKEEPSTPAELADEAGVTRATMTGLLDTLEKDGLVRRETDANDRRAVLVWITDAGAALLHGMLPSYFGTVSGIMQNLSHDERRLLVSLIQKIQASLAEPEKLVQTPPAAAVA